MTEQALFGAGCFWGVEDIFAQNPGVLSAVSGYAGGKVNNPGYMAVCTGLTGHVEVVQVTFDPAQTSYEALLDGFFQLHDPTTKNRQGPDHGSQYRSVIFYYNDAQKTAAEAAITRAQPRFNNPIVTELLPAPTFWRAEEYHQQYFKKHPGKHGCHVPVNWV